MIMETAHKSFSEALKKAISHVGGGAFDSETPLYALVNDFLGNDPQNKQSLNLLRNAIECGIPSRIRSVLDKDVQTKSLTIATCRMLLIDGYGVDERAAGDFMASFALALGWQVELEQTVSEESKVPQPEQKKNAVEAETIQQKQVSLPATKSPEELCGLGIRYFNQNDFPLAVSFFEKAAAQGNAVAQFNLGYCYCNGKGVKQDYAQAALWLQKSALQGIAQAQSILGHLYCKGQGVKLDLAKAADWFKKAALQGDSSGQFNLGFCYYYGDGVAKNLKEATHWLEKAAAQGNESAQVLLMKIRGKKK